MLRTGLLPVHSDQVLFSLFSFSRDRDQLGISSNSSLHGNLDAQEVHGCLYICPRSNWLESLI